MFGVTLDHCLVLTGCMLVRSLLTSFPHSGQEQPPMFGDYEAQRHWQEITLNLPVRQWYTNSTENDLLYWGLDYPPLTAYHSYLLGLTSRYLNPDFTELFHSRGTESGSHKMFMRNSVLLSDLLVFLPACFYFANSFFRPNEKSSSLTMALIGLYPGLILIDNGHFQYNDISLGLFVLAVTFVAKNCDLLATVSFVCALNYKQMELYHAMPFFSYLLGKCWNQPDNLSKFKKLVKIALAVIVTFGLIWAPFLSDLEVTLQVLRRIFPVNRGIFEDKVSNFWCSLNIAIKIKNLLAKETLVTMCLVTTFLTSLPSNVMVFLKPNLDHFLLSLVNTSFAFFLFSFQVHEKSILLVAIPVAMYAAVTDFGRYSSIISVWFLVLSVLSMWPLLVKDGLCLPCVSLTVFYLTGCLSTGYLNVVKQSPSKSPGHKRISPVSKPLIMLDNLVYGCLVASLVGIGLLLVLSLTVDPPGHLPFLWPVLISAYSGGHFMVFFIYFSWIQGSLFRQTVNYGMKKKVL